MDSLVYTFILCRTVFSNTLVSGWHSLTETKVEKVLLSLPSWSGLIGKNVMVMGYSTPKIFVNKIFRSYHLFLSLKVCRHCQIEQCTYELYNELWNEQNETFLEDTSSVSHNFVSHMFWLCYCHCPCTLSSRADRGVLAMRSPGEWPQPWTWRADCSGKSCGLKKTNMASFSFSISLSSLSP